MVNSSLSSLITKNLIEITRKLNEESLIYYYSIYTNGTWFMLIIVQLHHDVLAVEYRGRWKTTKLMIRNY